MTNRREVAAAALALFWRIAASANQTQPPLRPEPVFKHDLPNITMDGWEVTVHNVDYAPGRVGQPHRHPGFVLAYVLEGAVIAKISGQEERTYTAGQVFYEPPGSTHEVSKNASESQPARLLALIFAPKGARLTTPAQ